MGNKLARGKSIKSGASDAEIREFLKYVRPLDLLVFRGTEVFSKAIRVLETAVTGSGEISHVELCITREWCPSIGPLKVSSRGAVDGDRTLLSWGSTASGPLNDGVMNAETGKSKFGVQVRVLYDLVANYLKAPGGNVGVCRLHDNPTNQRPGEPLVDYTARKVGLIATLQKAYADYNGATYNANMLALLSALFPQLRCVNNASAPLLASFLNSNKWLFCSEFVATVYIDIGVITDATDGVEDGKTLNPSNVIPVDFIGFDTDSDGIRRSICDKPVWVKPLDTKPQSVLERMGTVVHNMGSIQDVAKLPLAKLQLINPLLTPAESSASMEYPRANEHGYKLSPPRGPAAADSDSESSDSESTMSSSSAISAEKRPASSDSLADDAAVAAEPVAEPVADVKEKGPAMHPTAPRINLTQMFVREPEVPSQAAASSRPASLRPESAKPASARPASSRPTSARPASAKQPASARADTIELALADAKEVLAEESQTEDDHSVHSDGSLKAAENNSQDLRASIVDDVTAREIDKVTKAKKGGRIRRLFGKKSPATSDTN